MESQYAPLSDACVKTLCEKTYDKRKLAATEIEKMVLEFNNAKNYTQIRRIINVLGQDLATSRDSNRRKGGLLGLAASSIAMGKDSEKFINELVLPVLNCMTDPEVRVRYFASEALYNVAKVARSAIIPLFPKVFASLSRLVTDPDENTKNGSELLDRLLKDIVIESSSAFDIEGFIPMLRERIYAKNSFARQFIISWISVLNTVPDIEMISYLPDLLDGLFQMLDDNSVEIQRTCDTLLAEFLKSIRKDPSSLDLPLLTNILVTHANSPNELIQAIAIDWIREFVHLSGANMLTHASGIFTAILPCLAYEGEPRKKIKASARDVNRNMLELVSSDSEKAKILEYLNLEAVLKVLRQYLDLAQSSVDTKVAALHWIHRLFTQLQNEMSPYATSLFPDLLKILSDESDEVVFQGLRVLAEIVGSTHSKDTTISQAHYRKFLLSLLNLFRDAKPFLDNRGAFIIRQLCTLLNAEFIFRIFAEIINEDDSNLKFSSTIVRTLNTILLTSSELFELRCLLRNINNERAASLFQCLYQSWSHCPISTLSLCLLAQCYGHASEIVTLLGDLEITVDLLTEMDKLVQLIESPIFASLRLTLVSQNRVEAQQLSQALFGLLMLLPQTEAFNLLKNRLQCVPNYRCVQDNAADGSVVAQSNIDFAALLSRFKETQQKQREMRIIQRKRNIALRDNSGTERQKHI